MSNATICFLLMLCSVVAFGQQPQWTVVQQVVLFHQNQAIPKTTLLTPNGQGIYRLNLYLSGGSFGEGNGQIAYSLNGFDITGAQIFSAGGIDCGSKEWLSMPPIMVSLAPQAPLTYQINDLTRTPTS